MKVIQISCPICKKPQQVEVSEEGYDRWQSGMLIQVALPELSADQREILKSGICPKCWDDMFAEEES